jgi:hypothetical protein
MSLSTTTFMMSFGLLRRLLWNLIIDVEALGGVCAWKKLSTRRK